MIREFVLFLVLQGIAFGQFQNLTTTDDGSILAFSSSLQMQGTNQFPYSKLFVIDSSGLSLYAQRPQGTTTQAIWTLTSYYLLYALEFSGDGGVSAIVSERQCITAGSSCFDGPVKAQSELSGIPGRGTVTLNGQVRMSRNGRYGVLCCDGAFADAPVLADLYTGETRQLPYAYQRARRQISSTGTAIVSNQQGFRLFTLAGSQQLPTAARPVQGVIDDSATEVIYEGQATGGKLLARVDIASGAEKTIVQRRDLSLAGATNDGSLVAFLSADPTGWQQLFVVNADGTGERQLTNTPGGVTEAVLAGYGAVAYATTAGGRILKIDVPSDNVAELVGRTVDLQLPLPGSGPDFVPGSSYCVAGNGFADSPASVAPPLPAMLSGFQLLLDGQALPLQSVTPSEACFQLPWETTIGTHTVSALTDSDRTFTGGETGSLSVYFDVLPAFVPLGSQYPVSGSLQPYPVAAHQDFSGILTPSNPARPGEIVHFYMTGLGPVNPPVQTGSAAPGNPPALAVAPVNCSLSDLHGGEIPLQVLFAGLAPGMAGYYQVSVQLPEQIPNISGNAIVVCASDLAYARGVTEIPVQQP